MWEKDARSAGNAETGGEDGQELFAGDEGGAPDDNGEGGTEAANEFFTVFHLNLPHLHAVVFRNRIADVGERCKKCRKRGNRGRRGKWTIYYNIM